MTDNKNKPTTGFDLNLLDTLKQAPVGITVLRGRNMIAEMANETYLQIVDRKEEEFVGRSLYESLPEVKDAVEPLLTNVFETGVPFHGREFKIPLKRFGTYHTTYFNFVYQPLRDNGEIVGVVVVANEVTDQVLARHKVQQSEDALKNIVKHSPFAMTVFRGPDFVIEMANDTLLKNIWRRELHEVEGKKLLDVFPELKAQKFPSLMQRVLETGDIYNEREAPVYVDASDGRSTFYLDYEYAPLFDTEGRVSGIMVSVNDSTEKVESRNKINDAERSLRIAVEATDLGTFDWNYALNIFISSARLNEIFGYFDGYGHTHQDLIDRLHPEDRPIRDKAIQDSLTLGALVYESRVIWGDGTIRWVKIYGKVVTNFNNQIRIIGTAQDITDHKEFSEKLEMEVKIRTKELQDINQELQISNNELAEFAYIASHDLQEPLRKIQTFISRIMEVDKSALSDRSKDYFGRMLSSMGRMRRLITDLLAYSSVNASADSFDMVDLNLVVNGVVENMTEQIETANGSITIETLPTVRAIRFQVEQLFVNLIANALKYAREKTPPVIHISADEVLGENTQFKTADHGVIYFKITVKDNGIGFPQEYNEKIFQVFQRLHGRSEYEGTGIGLAICRKIMENHRGFITSEGRPNHGAFFTMYFRS